MQLFDRIRRARRTHPSEITPTPRDLGGATLRRLWSDYTGDPYRQALDHAADRGALR